MSTLRFGRYHYLVEPVEIRDGLLLPVPFILHGPRGGTCLLVPHARDPERLFAIAPSGRLSFRRTPFDGLWFKVEGGELVIAAR